MNRSNQESPAPHGDARRRTLRRAATLAGVALATALLAGCGRSGASVLAPSGPRAERTAQLWWIMLALASAIFVAVVVLLGIALFRPRRDDGDESAGPPGGRLFVPIAGIAIPAVVLLFLFGLTLWALHGLAAPDEPAAMTIDVVGHQWWWEIRYADRDVVTANEIHIPAGEPIRMRLSSDDVIHSFWVPELAGKLDLIPGKINELWIEADRPGVYNGECAEFCGAEHALMGFRVIAEPANDFDTWIAEQRQPAAAPANDSVEAQGLNVFLTAGCIQCHTVRGTQATGSLGPDLTHIGSRRTIAAGTLPNTAGNLTAWISDPQAIKPGAFMPPHKLDAQPLHALVLYLLSLR